MSEKVFYKVLLVDDNKALGTSLQPQAERYSLDLQQCECWEDAMQMLSNKNDFLEWDAIILDARCVDKKGNPADLHFLTPALNELNSLFVTHGTSIPWYVFTAGGKKDFDFVIEDIRRISRDETWGNMLYFKHKPADDNGKDDVIRLFENIQRVAPLRMRNQILFLYKEVFYAMNTILKGKGVETLIEILTALHFPESRIGFNPDKEYNRLRKILESLFHSANQIGLLPDEFLTKEGKRNLTDASRYMAGKDPKHVQFRYGDKGEYIFPPIIADSVSNILSVTNTGSHIEAHQANLLFGYALQLCDVIVWFCNYAKNNSDKKANLAKCKPLKNETDAEQKQKPIFEEYEGKSFPLEYDKDNDVFYCGYCLLSRNQKEENVGKMVKLSGVVKNNNLGLPFKKYTYFATKVEVMELE